MNILKKDGTNSRTRVADVKQISFLNADDTTMMMRLYNGGLFRNKVNEVEELTFADTTYNLNSTGFRILESDELC